jgi:hypothetical protein
LSESASDHRDTSEKNLIVFERVIKENTSKKRLIVFEKVSKEAIYDFEYWVF